jgi:plastocyanin
VLALLAPLALAYCGDKSFGNLVLPITASAVSIQDQCDSVSFNAALGAGTCVKAGGVTFTQFETELAATGSVAGWQFVPSTMTMASGGTITATNNGGERHTFTQVAAFGGGSVPANNGSLVETPECAATTSANLIAPGASVTTPVLVAGTHLYQCCIHPWMHETVTVNP